MSPHMIQLGHGKFKSNGGGIQINYLGGPPNLTLSDKEGGGPKSSKKT